MGSRYDPITHQAEFSRLFDLDQARTNCLLFNRLFMHMSELIPGEPIEEFLGVFDIVVLSNNFRWFRSGERMTSGRPT